MSRESDREQIARQGFLDMPLGVTAARPAAHTPDQGWGYVGGTPMRTLNRTFVDTSASLASTLLQKVLPYVPIVGSNNPHAGMPIVNRFLIADNRFLLSLRDRGEFDEASVMDDEVAPASPGSTYNIATRYQPTPGRMTRWPTPSPIRRFFAPPVEGDENG